MSTKKLALFCWISAYKTQMHKGVRWRVTAPSSRIVGEQVGAPAQADWPAADALGSVIALLRSSAFACVHAPLDCERYWVRTDPLRDAWQLH